jgi:lactate permease
MTHAVLLLLSWSPVLLILSLVLLFNKPAQHALAGGFLLTSILSGLIWQTPWPFIAAACLKGLVTALDIMLIIFGAFVLLCTLQQGNAFSVIYARLSSLSTDRRVQTLLIAWLFGAFLEGAAGFGVPVALLSPVLVGLGFPALAAVMVTLLSNATPVSFGPVGVPTILGLGMTLDKPVVHHALTNAGWTYAYFLQQLGWWTAVLHALVAIFWPLLTVALLTRVFGKSWRAGLQIWPLALLSGLAFVLPYLAAAYWLGPEFPSLLGGLAGFLILAAVVKSGLCKPKTTWDFPDRSQWDTAWSGSEVTPISPGRPRSLWLGIAPYGLVALLLIVTRIERWPVKTFLKKMAWQQPHVLTTDISLRLEPLYNPGLLPFIAVALLSVFLLGMNRHQVRLAWQEAIRKIKIPLLVLLFSVPLVQIMQLDHSGRGWQSMLALIADSAARLGSRAWPLLSPFVGAFGAFLAGSNTVSNMLFGLLQFSVADRLQLSHVIIVSLQNVGGSFGVLVCFFKMIAGCASVGLLHKEKTLLRLTLGPCLIYGLTTGLAAMALIYWFKPGLF